MNHSQQNDAATKSLASRQANPSEALRRSEEQFRLLVKAVTEYAIFRLDPAGHVTSWNAGAERIKGYAETEILGRHFSTFHPSDDVEAGVPEHILETARREGQWTGEGWRVRKDGSRFWAHVTITALRGDDNELRGFAKVTRDMTKRRKREEKLAHEKQRADRKNALLRLMQTVAATANDADSLEEAMREATRAVCEHTGWPVGHVYRVDRQDGETRLVPTGIWSLRSEERFGRFRTATEATTLAVGEGLPGRVAEGDEPTWIRDVTRDSNFTRAQVADNLGVKGAFGVPVRHQGETVAVLEFFSTMEEEPDEKLLEAMASVGVQLSRVAERECAERTLRESEEKFRALSEKALVGVAMLQGSRYTYVNPAYADIVGYAPEEIIGHSPEMFFHPEDRSVVEEQVRRRLEGETDEAHYEARMLTKDGEIRHVEIFGSRITYQGEPTIIGMALDITDRKRADRALRESEVKFRALAEESPVGILLIREDGRLEYVNETLAEMYGYSREALFDVAYADKLVHPSDRKRVRKNIKKRLDGEHESMQFRFRGLTKDGETIRVDAYGTRVEYQGKPAIIGMDIDVTNRLRLQRELLRVQEEERRRIGQDLHDGVASQLTGIGIMLGVLARHLDNNDDLVERVREIRELVNESCDDVRRLSRGLAPASLSGKSFVETLERLAKTTEGGRFEKDDDLPPLEDDAAAHLYWIAQEAVTNARKYAAADRITIRLRNKEDTFALEVDDDGKGFNPDKIEDGLGLRSMHYRADLLSGTLTIDSSPGDGTRICCYLPK